MDDLSVTNAHLIGLFVEIFATGVYVVYLARCVGILRVKIREGMSKWLPLACAMIFLCILGDFVVEMYIGYQAFSVHPGDKIANPVKEFSNISSPESIAKGIFTAVLAMFSDIIIVYRTYVVWNFKKLVIVLPVGLLLASWAVGIWSIWTEAQTGIKEIGVILADVTIRVRYFFILTFVLNVLCSGLICWRIWRVTSRTSPHLVGDSSTAQIMYIVIESAALYCANLLALIITNCVGSNAFFIFLNMLPPVNAIVFSLLITRSRTGNTQQQASTMASTTIRFGTNSRRTADIRSHPGPSPFEVGISLEHMTHTDSTQRYEDPDYVLKGSPV